MKQAHVKLLIKKLELVYRKAKFPKGNEDSGANALMAALDILDNYKY